MSRKRKRLLSVGMGLVLLLVLLLTANAGYYLGTAYSGEYCANCHLIEPSVESLKTSSHRNVSCESCHGSAFTFDLSVHLTHWRRVADQMWGKRPERVLLEDDHVDRVAERCGVCHQNAYAQWLAGGHSMSYADVYFSPDQNSKNLLNDDCMRCHGMFFEGDITQIVTPIDLKGPWKEVVPGIGARPAIPCLACHQMHRLGEPVKRPDYARPTSIFHGRLSKVSSLAFYDRREAIYIPADSLPLPRMFDDGRPVRLSPDPRQGVCYQCHAPEARREVGTGDDRTCVGVHEGISCLGCHATHSQDSRASCNSCHPKMSNCGLDVETMDTTFKSPDSPQNVHFVKCQDCHKEGVPTAKTSSL